MSTSSHCVCCFALQANGYYFCTITLSRHTHASGRPRFRELTIDLTGNELDVLSIPEEDLHTHKLAGVLGAPVDSAKDMYLDLQNKYMC